MTFFVSEAPSPQDTLTNIQSRETFLALLPTLVASAARDRRPIGFLIVSQSLHATGKLTLPDQGQTDKQEKMIACIEATLRSADIAVRLSDGEFGILLTNTTDSQGNDGFTSAALRYASKLQECDDHSQICMGVARLDLPNSLEPSSDVPSQKGFDQVAAAEAFFSHADIAWSHACTDSRTNPGEAPSIFLYDSTENPTAIRPLLVASQGASQGEALQV